MTNHWRLVVLVSNLIVMNCPLAVSAASAEPETGDDWRHSVFLYLLGPTIEGTAGFGSIDVDIEIDPGTVFDSLEAGFLGGYAAEKDGWGFMLDLAYIDLSKDFTIPGLGIEGELGIREAVAGLSALYRLNDRFQLMGGILYTDVSMTFSSDGSIQPLRVEAGDSWFDPVVGLRFDSPLSERCSLTAFGQVGGGVNADLVWQATASFNYQMTRRSNLLLGYRYFDLDYEAGEGMNRFKFDFAEHGPGLGFRFDF